MRSILPILLLLPTVAWGQSADRYQMEATDDGYVRLDKHTGAMSICSESGGQLVCRMAADERAALEDETGRLRGELESLAARVAKLEEARPAVPLPTEEDIDKTLGVMQHLFRGFAGIVKELQGDGTEEGPQPDRT